MTSPTGTGLRSPWISAVLTPVLALTLVTRLIDLAQGADWGVWSWVFFAFNVVALVVAAAHAVRTWRARPTQARAAQ